MKTGLGLLLALCFGIASRLGGIPLPAPPVLIGALLVVAMTVGYIVIGRFAEHREARSRENCGGPTGETKVRQ